MSSWPAAMRREVRPDLQVVWIPLRRPQYPVAHAEAQLQRCASARLAAELDPTAGSEDTSSRSRRRPCRDTDTGARQDRRQTRNACQVLIAGDGTPNPAIRSRGRAERRSRMNRFCLAKPDHRLRCSAVHQARQTTRGWDQPDATTRTACPNRRVAARSENLAPPHVDQAAGSFEVAGSVLHMLF